MNDLCPHLRRSCHCDGSVPGLQLLCARVDIINVSLDIIEELSRLLPSLVNVSAAVRTTSPFSHSISTYWKMTSTFMTFVVHKVMARGRPTDRRCEDLVWKEGVAKRFLNSLQIRLVATCELGRVFVNHTANRQHLHSFDRLTYLSIGKQAPWESFGQPVQGNIGKDPLYPH